MPFEGFFNFADDNHSFFRQIIELLGLLKLLRIARLSSTVRKLNMDAEIKVYFKILQMCLIILIIVHVLSCFWLFIVADN